MSTIRWTLQLFLFSLHLQPPWAIDSLLSNFNRYNGSDESYFLSLFSGTPFKYTRKSNNEYIFLPNPYCSIIGSTQPGMLSSLFGGKRSQNGFSSRFLKVYPDIAAMPSWNEASMPEEVLDEWERIIRQVDSVQPPAGQEGKTNSLELFFSQAAKQCLIRWKNEVNCRIYVESESWKPTSSASVWSFLPVGTSCPQSCRRYRPGHSPHGAYRRTARPAV